MKRIIAVLLSLVCIIGLFCGCSEKKEEPKEPVKLNLLNCGFEFGMSKAEVDEMGKKTINPKFDESQFIGYKAQVDPFFEGTAVEMPSRILFNFGLDDSLQYIYILINGNSEGDAEIIRDNALELYSHIGTFSETIKKGIPTYIAENENMKVYIDYTKEYKKVRIFLALPGVEIPIY